MKSGSESIIRRCSLCAYAFLCLSVALLCSGVEAKAQDWAVKTNLLYDVTTTLNVGGEWRFAPEWTLDVSGNLNPWGFKDNTVKFKHWIVQPEVRWWLCDAWMGSFFAVHGIVGQMNVGGWNSSIKMPVGNDFSLLKDYRYQGWMTGLGLAYGYAWVLDRHWDIEVEAGAGWIYSRTDTYRCADCGKKVEEGVNHHYFGPTKFSVGLVYVF